MKNRRVSNCEMRHEMNDGMEWKMRGGVISPVRMSKGGRGRCQNGEGEEWKD